VVIVIPLVTAAIGAAVVFAAALISRASTNYAAELSAAQRRRDAEIAHLGEFRNALIEALTSFATYRHILGRIPAADLKAVAYERAVEALEEVGGYSQFRVDTVLQLERVRNLAMGLMWPDLRSEFEPLDALLSPRDDLLGTAINATENADLIEAFVVMVARRQRTLIETYPSGRSPRFRRRGSGCCPGRGPS
jgi:hypothetical protein